MKLKNYPLLAPEIKSIIVSLEASSHEPTPLFRNIWTTVPLLAVEGFKEKPGISFEGYVLGDHYSIIKSHKPTCTEENCATLYKNGKELFHFIFDS